MIDDNAPVEFDDPLPESADVVVIGAGVIGIATAWFLTRAGLSVVVCEKGRVAGEQSSRNWGWIRQQGRDAAELPIVMESVGLWESFAAELETDIGFRRGGILYLAPDAERLDTMAEWLDVARDQGLDTRLVDAAGVDALIDDRPGQWAGALYTPSDARAEPFVAVPALAHALRASGCTIRERCAVRAVDTAAGAARGVVTEHGPVRAQAVVCCAGAWSSRFLRGLGIDLPQLVVRATVARTAPGPEVFAGAAAGPDLAFRRRADGGYTLALSDHLEHFIGPASFRHARAFLPALRATWHEMRLRVGTLGQPLQGGAVTDPDAVSPFEQTRVLNPPPSAGAVKRMSERLARRLPRLAGLAIEQAWAGMIDATPDMVPVMDAAPGVDGLWIATGFSGHGFGIGPAAGRIMADLVQGRPPGHDLSRFRFARFRDGSPLELGPVI